MRTRHKRRAHVSTRREYHHKKSSGLSIFFKSLFTLMIIASALFVKSPESVLPTSLMVSDVVPETTPSATLLPTPEPTPAINWQENIRPPLDDQIYLAWDQWRKDLEEVPPGINVISPHWFEVVKVGDKSEVFILSEIKDSWSDWEPTEYIETAHAAGVKVWALVQNMENYSAYEYIVTTEEGRQHFYSRMKEWVEQYGLDGICLDFEHMNPEHSAQYSEFAAGLKQALPPDCVVSACVTVNLPGDHPNNWWQCYDRDTLAAGIDYICVMAYDNHRDNTMEPVAGIQWVDEHVRRILEEVPSDKVLLGVPFYGTDYRSEVQDGDIFATRPMWKDSGWTTTVFNLNSALSNGQYKKSDDVFIVDYWLDKGSWDSEIGISTYAFVDTNGILHHIWIDDENSLYQKGRLAVRYNLGGVAVWKKSLGTDPMWEALLRGITE